MTKYSNFKDYQLRHNIKKQQSNIFLLKSFLHNEKIQKKIRFKLMLRYSKLYQTLSGNKFKNRCINSTKIRAVSRIVNLTKSSFRDNLHNGNICGFHKSSW